MARSRFPSANVLVTASPPIKERARSQSSVSSTDVSSKRVKTFATKFARTLTGREFSARDLFEPLVRPVMFARFGISPEELHRFDEITPDVMVFTQEKVEVHGESGASREDAAFALDFATRSLLKMEEWRRRNAKTLRQPPTST